MRYTYKRLKVFISSTADLATYRNQAEMALAGLEIDGIRFEAWPSTPENPVAKCLDEVRSSDAMVLLLGDRYGTATSGGISVTHLEYKEARNSSPQKPVFAYVLPPKRRESRQQAFVDEVEQDLFRSCGHVASSKQLAGQVRMSFLAEFARCFRDAWQPQGKPSLPSVPDVALLQQSLPANADEALPFLSDLYARGDNLAIHELRPLLISRFDGASDHMGFLHMATINLAMSGYRIDSVEVDDAIVYWENERVAKRITTASRYYNLGNALGALGKHQEAVEKFKLALEADDSMAEIWKNLGTAHEMLRDIELAERSYRKALAIDSKLFEARLALGQLLLNEGRDTNEALEVLNGIAVGQLSSEHHASVADWKAVAYQKLGEHEKAIASANQAIKMAPSAYWAWRWGARVHSLAWRENRQYLTVSRGFFQRFTRKYPDDAEAWAELGQVLWLQHFKIPNKQTVDEARSAFEKAFALGIEESAVLLDRFGHALQDCGELTRAEEAFRRAFELDSSIGYCLGVCLISQGRYKEALPYLENDAESVHRDDRSWFQVAVCHANCGRFGEAEEAYVRAIHLDPDYPHAWFNLGGLYWNMHDVRRAVRIWKRALKKFPAFERAQEAREILRQLMQR